LSDGVRVIHGDCLKVMPTLEAGSIDCILTDIPYSEAEAVHIRAHDPEWRGRFSPDRTEIDAADFSLDEIAAEFMRLCRGSIYVFCGVVQVSRLTEAFRAAGLSTRHCVWRKTNPAPTNGQHLWVAATENCVYAKRPGAIFNERCAHNVWDAPVTRNEFHPSQKPPALFGRLVMASTRPGDLVLDPFAGSGTAGVACLKSGRRCILIERARKYIPVINRRLADAATPLFDALP
jgi:DNA modification methylase